MIEKSYTDEEIAAIAQKHKMPRYPKIALLRADKSALGFLGYEFRYVKDRRYGTGGNYLTYGPSMKSVKKVCAKVKEQTLSIFKPVKNEEVVQRVNKILVG